jgi:alpha-amylase/alpha-mannosidase (GH57 family)
VATVTFLWHLHQPSYRTRDGKAHAPWVAIHAGGGYRTLLKAIRDTDAPGQVVNVVPTLIEQLEAYRDDRVDDSVLTALTTPSSQLDAEQRKLVVNWSPNVPPRQVDRFPRLRELVNRARAFHQQNSYDAAFGVGDLRDLQVLFVLAHAGSQADRETTLRPLAQKGRHFTADQHAQIAGWLERQPEALLGLLGEISDQSGVEIATSPYAHPIIPLLIDTEVAIESCSPGPAPQIASFSHPSDADLQIEAGLRFMRERGFAVVGCWPPEGSVSTAALNHYSEAGVKWLVTDEGILAQSLGRSIRTPDGCARELYSPWQIKGDSPVLFFRDRWLSDRIGFTYGRWDDERAAARDLLDHLCGMAQTLPADAAIVIALDGENPWPHYVHGGADFLDELFNGLSSCKSKLRPATFAELASDLTTNTLDRLHPGSWINSVFATWIGHPEKTRAWDLLARVRNALPKIEGEIQQAILLAEGSDWFWWLGDDNPTDLAPLYDRIFRHHLKDACSAAGIQPPNDLAKPLKSPTRHVSAPISKRWPPPTISGSLDSYFDWAIATWVDTHALGPISRIGLWGTPTQLFVVITGAEPLESSLESSELVVSLIGEDRTTIEVKLGSTHPRTSREPDARLGRVAEIAFPWNAEVAYRLQLQLDGMTVPDGATMVLHPDWVDELAPVIPKKEWEAHV